MKTKLPKEAKAISNLEATLNAKMQFVGIPKPEREVRFCERKWRFDFCWRSFKVAAECEGGTWTGGRHTRGGGFEDDCDKYNRAAIDGWCVLRFTAKHINDNSALDMIEEALRSRGYSQTQTPQQGE